MTTALYPNRMTDKAKVERLGFTEEPDAPTPLYLPDGTLFSHSYTRIVYGDHGPYVELTKEHLACPLKRHWGKKGDPLPPEHLLPMAGCTQRSEGVLSTQDGTQPAQRTPETRWLTLTVQPPGRLCGL